MDQYVLVSAISDTGCNGCYLLLLLANNVSCYCHLLMLLSSGIEGGGKGPKCLGMSASKVWRHPYYWLLLFLLLVLLPRLPLLVLVTITVIVTEAPDRGRGGLESRAAVVLFLPRQVHGRLRRRCLAKNTDNY